VTQLVTLGVGATGYLRVTKQVRVTVEVCGYEICIQRVRVKTCKSDTSIGNVKILTDTFQGGSDQIGKSGIYDIRATRISALLQIWERYNT
jgi:hypothetical protein